MSKKRRYLDEVWHFGAEERRKFAALARKDVGQASVWKDKDGVGLDSIQYFGLYHLPAVQGAIRETRKYGGEELLRQTFLGLYPKDAFLVGENEVDEDNMPSWILLSLGVEMPEWEVLHRKVYGRSLPAIYAAAHFAIEMLRNMPEEVKQAAEKAQCVIDRKNGLKQEKQGLQDQQKQIQEAMQQGPQKWQPGQGRQTMQNQPQGQDQQGQDQQGQDQQGQDQQGQGQQGQDQQGQDQQGQDQQGQGQQGQGQQGQDQQGQGQQGQGQQGQDQQGQDQQDQGQQGQPSQGQLPGDGWGTPGMDAEVELTAIQHRISEIDQQLAGLGEDMRKKNADLRRVAQENIAQMKQNSIESSKKARSGWEAMESAAKMMGVGANGFALDNAGGIPPDMFQSVQQLAALIQKDRMFAAIAEMLGRVEKAINEAKMETAQAGTIFVEYQQGGSFDPGMSPQDFGLFALTGADDGGIMDTLFAMRMMNGEIRVPRYEGEAPTDRGPLWVLIDKSGSMSGVPSAIASATALALALECMRDGRKFGGIVYSGTGQYTAWEPEGNITLDRLLEFVNFGFGGGTEPYAPLTYALERIQQDAVNLRSYGSGRENTGWAHADVIHITDGHIPAPTPGFVQLVDELREYPGLSMVTVMIGVLSGNVAQFCNPDEILVISQLGRMKDHLAEIIKKVI